MINLIEFLGEKYPHFQSTGNAARFAIPFAQEVCKGRGLDIGCNMEEWKFPGAIAVDPALNRYDALNLPVNYNVAGEAEGWDYIFSSHCLEHLNSWVFVLNHWRDNLKSGGVLFLYLPHPSQEYWLPWNNTKHVNILHPEDIERYLNRNGFKNIFVSERDLNHSFMVMAEKI